MRGDRTYIYGAATTDATAAVADTTVPAGTIAAVGTGVDGVTAAVSAAANAADYDCGGRHHRRHHSHRRHHDADDDSGGYH